MPIVNMSGKLTQSNEWVVDSGDTEHITYNLDWLRNKTKGVHETPVVIPNGDTVPVEGRGDCTLLEGTIKGFLHIPDFIGNLLSIIKLINVL